MTESPLLALTEALDVTVEYLGGAERIEDEPTFAEAAQVFLVALRLRGFRIVAVEDQAND